MKGGAGADCSGTYSFDFNAWASAGSDPGLIAGTVVFVFQPAEEGLPTPGPHGAKRMVEEKVLADPLPSAVRGVCTSG